MITLRVKLLSGIESVVGLIGKNPSPVMFYTRFGIHTFGLKFPIDVLILDENSKVIKIKENLKPNNFFFWNPKYSGVIELPMGTIKKSRILVENKIKLVVQ